MSIAAYHRSDGTALSLPRLTLTYLNLPLFYSYLTLLTLHYPHRTLLLPHPTPHPPYLSDLLYIDIVPLPPPSSLPSLPLCDPFVLFHPLSVTLTLTLTFPIYDPNPNPNLNPNPNPNPLSVTLTISLYVTLQEQSWKRRPRTSK